MLQEWGRQGLASGSCCCLPLPHEFSLLGSPSPRLKGLRVEALCHGRQLLLGQVSEQGRRAQRRLVPLLRLRHGVNHQRSEGEAIQAPQLALAQRCGRQGGRAGRPVEARPHSAGMQAMDGTAGGRLRASAAACAHR